MVSVVVIDHYFQLIAYGGVVVGNSFMGNVLHTKQGCLVLQVGFQVAGVGGFAFEEGCGAIAHATGYTLGTNKVMLGIKPGGIHGYVTAGIGGVLLFTYWPLM